jgi:hypothetical protein
MESDAMLWMHGTGRWRAACHVAAGRDANDAVAWVAADAEDQLAPRPPTGIVARRAFLQQLAKCVVGDALLEHHRRQSQWSQPTDCDRLDRAFVRLGRSGIIGRHDFTCCQTCGHAEIEPHLWFASKVSTAPIWGYVFYHMQDTDRAVQGGRLFLRFGAFDGGGGGGARQRHPGLRAAEDAATACGREIVAALTAEGLCPPEWPGEDPGTAISVQLRWMRRRDPQRDLQWLCDHFAHARAWLRLPLRFTWPDALWPGCTAEGRGARCRPFSVDHISALPVDGSLLGLLFAP